MKKNKIILAATPAILASAALALSFSFPVNADSLIVSYAAVLALGVIVTVEYRIKWNWLFGR